MVDEKMIEQWKSQYGKVFKINPGIEIYYRTLNREDYIALMQLQAAGEEIDHELETCRRCILNDVSVEVLSNQAGIATVVYEQIMQNSGFLVVESEEL